MTSKILTRVATGVTTVALLAVSVAPAFAANVNVSGNKRNSNNNVNVSNNKATVVSQSTNTGVVNTVLNNQNTGNNKAKDNGGNGVVMITTGPANANATLGVAGGSNVVNAGLCGCMNDVMNINVSGNGRSSNNNVNLFNNWSSVLGQSSTTTVVNTVSTNQNTGGNTANDNDGTVIMTTGGANSNVNTVVTGGSNVAGM